MNAIPFVPPSGSYRSSLGVQTQIDTLYSAVSSATQTANTASNEAATVGNELTETNKQVATNTGDIVTIKAGMGIMAGQIVTLSGKTADMSVSGTTTIFGHTIRCLSLEINSETQSQAYTTADHTAVGTISGLTTKVSDLETKTAPMTLGYDGEDFHDTVDFASTVRCKALSFLEGAGSVGYQIFPYTSDDRTAVQSISGLTIKVSDLETKTAPMTIGYDAVNLLTASVFSNATVRCNTLTVVGAGNTGVQRHPYTDADRSLLQAVSNRTVFMSAAAVQGLNQTVFSGRIVSDTVLCQSIQLQNPTQAIVFPNGTVQTSAYIPAQPTPLYKFEAYSNWSSPTHLNPYPNFGPKLIGLPGYPLGRNTAYGPVTRNTHIGIIVQEFDPTNEIFYTNGFFKTAGKYYITWDVHCNLPKWVKQLQGYLYVDDVTDTKLIQSVTQGTHYTYENGVTNGVSFTCSLFCEIPDDDTWQLNMQLLYEFATNDEAQTSSNTASTRLNTSIVVRQVY
jgi:hypothetical protein